MKSPCERIVKKVSVILKYMVKSIATFEKMGYNSINIHLGGYCVKNITLLVWLTQLGFSVVFPPVGFLLLAAWLKNSRGWGSWVIWVAVALGVICAVDGLRTSLKAMDTIARNEKKEEPPVAFNEHQ